VDRRRALICLHDTLELEAQRLQASMLVWKDFPKSYDNDLRWLTEQRRMFRMVSFPSTIVSFPTSRKNDYFAMLKSSRRYNLKKKLRQSKEQLDVQVEVVQAPDASTVDDLFRLFWQTYNRSTTKFEVLNKRYFEIVATKPVSNFVILRERHSGEMVAFMQCFKLGDRIINKFIGIDYGRPKECFLYFRLWDAAVDWALGCGAISMQSGQTGYGAKIEIGHQLISLANYGLHRNWLLHRVFSAVAKRICWETLDSDLAHFIMAHPDAGADQ
jgi:predicted N-acyltransferase